jgi:glycyl-tRNA synthetase
METKSSDKEAEANKIIEGQFLNFAKLLEFNQNSMPFASASIGKSFRNEISPRSGLLRVREFTMAEIEHYVDPQDKSHTGFADVKDVKIALLNRETQLAGKTTPDLLTIGEAVAKKIVDNETLGYFLTRIQAFLLKIGCDPKKLRCKYIPGARLVVEDTVLYTMTLGHVPVLLSFWVEGID